MNTAPCDDCGKPVRVPEDHPVGSLVADLHRLADEYGCDWAEVVSRAESVGAP